MQQRLFSSEVQRELQERSKVNTNIRIHVFISYHWGDDGGGGGDLVVGGPLRGQGDGVEEEGLQDVLPEGDVVRTLPAQDHRRRTQRVNGQLTDAGRLWHVIKT